MHFRFKLSQRLARLKATLAVSVVLALACQSDLTDPKPPYSSPKPSIFAADLTPLTAASVVASGNDGNLPQNTLDQSLATRWSAQGDGQWIQYDLGALTALNRLGIAWYLGDSRVASFDIAVSLDAVTWTKVFSGQSSGTTLQPELYTFPTAAGRYVRIVGHGNSLSAWTSITEVAIIGTTTITAPSCVTSTAAWQNVAIPSQTGAFEVPFDATPSTANMDGVVGLANGPAADYTNLAPIVRFNPTGTIDARNGGDYAAATAIPYTPGTTYHFRLDVNLASHTYDIYVTPAGAVERLLGRNFAFRTEQAALSVLNNLGLYAKVGSATVCNPGVSAWTPPARAPVASVAVSPATASPQVGQTAQLSATPKDSGGAALTGRTVTWTSGNTSMVTVSSSGLVKGVAAGTATITATSEGKAGSAAVTVTLVPVASVVVSPAPATLPLHGTIQLGVTLKDASGNPLTGRTVAWTSSTPTIMTVSATGLVTDVADGGTATVTATSEGKSGTSAITVQAPLPSGSVPDPTLLPVASGQLPNVAAYTALNVPGQPAGFSYNDPVTGVRVWKVTSATTPMANGSAGHDYADGSNSVSRGWGPNNNTHTLVFGVPQGSANYWLVDFTRGVGFSNYRKLPVQPNRDLSASFASVAGQERILYIISGSQLVRFNTATMALENTGFFPVNLGQTAWGWLQQDKSDTWFVGMVVNNQVLFAFNAQTGQYFTYTDATGLGSGRMEPRLERDGRYAILENAQTTVKLWDLSTNTLGPTQTIATPFFHNADLRGHWISVNANASSPFAEDRYDVSGGLTVNRTQVMSNSGGPDVHNAGNWVQSDAELGGNLLKQWSFLSGFSNIGAWPGTLWTLAIGLMRSDGSDARLLLHHYSTNAASQYWADRKSTRLNSSHVRISYA